MHLIDTHAHITSEELYPDIDEILSRAQENQVKSIVNICTDSVTLSRGLELSRKFPWVYNTAAITPHDAEEFEACFFAEIEQAAQRKQLVAIGETGLDLYNAQSSEESQRYLLLKHLELAKAFRLPLVFHCREAFQELFSVVDGFSPSVAALLHCFTGTKEEGISVIERGWLISVSGIITFKKSEKLREVIRFLPLDRLVIETDAPYLAPHSHRGKRNEPSLMIETAQTIAQIKGISLESVSEETRKNAESFFLF